jgi:hypothetical protein
MRAEGGSMSDGGADEPGEAASKRLQVENGRDAMLLVLAELNSSAIGMAVLTFVCASYIRHTAADPAFAMILVDHLAVTTTAAVAEGSGVVDLPVRQS